MKQSHRLRLTEHLLNRGWQICRQAEKNQSKHRAADADVHVAPRIALAALRHFLQADLPEQVDIVPRNT